MEILVTSVEVESVEEDSIVKLVTGDTMKERYRTIVEAEVRDSDSDEEGHHSTQDNLLSLTDGS